MSILSKAPEPKYLNLEYLFNQFFELLKFLWRLFIYLLSLLASMVLEHFALILSLVLFVVLGVIIWRMIKLKMKRRDIFMVKFKEEEKEPKERSVRWGIVKKKIKSDNPADWQVAIIEADTILEDVFRTMGYSGDNFGEILKNIVPADFESLQDIWDAHKLRNKIAHPPHGFKLEKEDAEDAVGKFERGLKELKYL